MQQLRFAPILGSTFPQASLSPSRIFEFSARPLQTVRTMDPIARPAKMQVYLSPR
ncbi:hypothetical protein C8Q76DRAFT_738979 [Earliella scabrosa]|nr:hypothetical protein C8Q76DRAFT_738979 [Earliella scabrosa]